MGVSVSRSGMVAVTVALIAFVGDAAWLGTVNGWLTLCLTLLCVIIVLALAVWDLRQQILELHEDLDDLYERISTTTLESLD